MKKKNQLGDLILPIAAIRGDGTSNDYFPAEIPALPAFSLQKQFRQQYANTDWTTGQVRCTQQTAEFGNMMINLKKYLRTTRSMAIDMETATIFIAGFANQIPTGALLLVSDQPMISEGVKTEMSDNMVTEKYVETHLNIGIDSLKQLIENRQTVKHLRF